MSILEIKGVNKRFGGLQALDDVNLNVEEGTIHAIIGPNGAGKSTLLNCFIGKLMPDSGTVTFDGQSLLGLKPWQINQAGVSRVFQTPEIFSDLSVMENVMIPCFARRDGMFRLNGIAPTEGEADIRDKAEQMLIDVRMQDKLHMQAGSLSRTAKISALKFRRKSGSASKASRMSDMICVDSMVGLESLLGSSRGYCRFNVSHQSRKVRNLLSLTCSLDETKAPTPTWGDSVSSSAGTTRGGVPAQPRFGPRGA